MIVMLDTAHDLDEASLELGAPVEQLLTPLTRYKLRGDGMFAIDNGAFSRFDAAAYRALLARETANRSRCRFVTAPDVVGDARRTLEVFDWWRSQLNGWPVALVAQDGQEHLPIPWGRIDAVFVGGSTGWKMGAGASAIIKAAQAIGKWCHVGRVNTPGRFEHFEQLGADSIDGTGLSRYSWMRKAIHERATRPVLSGLGA